MKISVVCNSCSGKTTLSKTMAAKLKLNHIELDTLFWLPNWTKPSDEVFRNRLDQATSGDDWITDGMYPRFKDLTFERADVIIWLNYSFLSVMFRALKRTIPRGISRIEIFKGCRESIYTSFFSRRSILLWVITTWKKNRKKFRTYFDTRAFGDIEYVELRNQKEADRYLASLYL